MMPRQQFHPGALGRLTQPFAVLDGVRQRLLDEGRNAGSDTGKPLLDMQSIGRRKNDAVGTLLEQVRQRGDERHAKLCGDVRGARRRIDDRHQLAVAAFQNALDVRAPDGARSHNRNAQGGCHSPGTVCSPASRDWALSRIGALMAPKPL